MTARIRPWGLILFGGHLPKGEWRVHKRDCWMFQQLAATRTCAVCLFLAFSAPREKRHHPAEIMISA